MFVEIRADLDLDQCEVLRKSPLITERHILIDAVGREQECLPVPGGDVRITIAETMIQPVSRLEVWAWSNMGQFKAQFGETGSLRFALEHVVATLHAVGVEELTIRVTPEMDELFERLAGARRSDSPGMTRQCWVIPGATLVSNAEKLAEMHEGVRRAETVVTQVTETEPMDAGENFVGILEEGSFPIDFVEAGGEREEEE